MPKKPLNLKIRKARADDIESVLIIDSESSAFKKKEMVHMELSNQFSNFYIATVPESKKIIGYIIYWIIENDLEIHHFAVKNEFQQKGVGSALIQYLLTDARKKKVKQIFLEVRRSNFKAIQFYNKFCFKSQGVREKYYRNPEEDAIVFVCTLD
jgi:ribosomal-protein-alanine acetyltransferase